MNKPEAPEEGPNAPHRDVPHPDASHLDATLPPNTGSEQLSSTVVKKRQWWRLIWVVIGLGFSIGMLWVGLAEDASSPSPHETIGFTPIVNTEALRSAWLERFQTDVQKQAEVTTRLQEQMAAWSASAPRAPGSAVPQSPALPLSSDTEEAEEGEGPSGIPSASSAPPVCAVSSTPSEPTLSGTASSTVADLKNAVTTLTATVSHLSAARETPTPEGHAPVGVVEEPPWVGEDIVPLVARAADQEGGTPRFPAVPAVSRVSLTQYVPSGTHALGVLLMGAELVSSDYDQANPKPILIRLVSEGTLPNHHTSHLKGCVVTAAMTGEISSGRGNVRLERLSCVHPDGTMLDIPVTGVVATYGQEGITGERYTREARRVAGATIAGALAGMAEAVHRMGSSDGSRESGLGTSPSAMGRSAGAQGVGQGLNRLSDFELQRAEQLHPVISIHGGRLVTVVFTQQGFYLDGQTHNDSVNGEKETEGDAEAGESDWGSAGATSPEEPAVGPLGGKEPEVVPPLTEEASVKPGSTISP